MSYSAPPPTAAMLRMLVGVVVEVGEPALPQPKLADAAGRDQLAHRNPRRVVAVHERFHEQDARPVARVDHPPRVGSVSAMGFSHSTCLPASRRGDGPGGVEVVGQRNVDGIDVRDRRAVPRTSHGRAECPAARRPRARARGRARRWPPPRSAVSALMPGITFQRAMSAVERTPKRSSANGQPHDVSRDRPEGHLEDPFAARPGEHEQDGLGDIGGRIIPASWGMSGVRPWPIAKSVATPPGQTLVQRTPCSRSSWSRAAVSPTWANFEAQYTASLGRPRRPASLAMVTMSARVTLEQFRQRRADARRAAPSR